MISEKKSVAAFIEKLRPSFIGKVPFEGRNLQIVQVLNLSQGFSTTLGHVSTFCLSYCESTDRALFDYN